MQSVLPRVLNSCSPYFPQQGPASGDRGGGSLPFAIWPAMASLPRVLLNSEMGLGSSSDPASLQTSQELFAHAQRASLAWQASATSRAHWLGTSVATRSTQCVESLPARAPPEVETCHTPPFVR